MLTAPTTRTLEVANKIHQRHTDQKAYDRAHENQASRAIAERQRTIRTRTRLLAAGAALATVATAGTVVVIHTENEAGAAVKGAVSAVKDFGKWLDHTSQPTLQSDWGVVTNAVTNKAKYDLMQTQQSGHAKLAIQQHVPVVGFAMPMFVSGGKYNASQESGVDLFVPSTAVTVNITGSRDKPQTSVGFDVSQFKVESVDSLPVNPAGGRDGFGRQMVGAILPHIQSGDQAAQYQTNGLVNAAILHCGSLAMNDYGVGSSIEQGFDQILSETAIASTGTAKKVWNVINRNGGVTYNFYTERGADTANNPNPFINVKAADVKVAVPPIPGDAEIAAALGINSKDVSVPQLGSCTIDPQVLVNKQ